MRILITGGSGFIGKNLVTHLKKKHRIFSPTHTGLDLSSYHQLESFFKNNQIDKVIHSALIGNTRIPESNHQNFYLNLQLFFNLVNCQKYFKQLIYFGSGAEFDKSRPIINISEDNFGQNIPTDDYGYFKFICNHFTKASSAKKFINLRLFGIFGPYENYLIKFISNTIVKNILHLPIIINQDVYFDYLYINDLLPIIDNIISHQTKYNDYNICTGQKISLSTIAKKIIKIGGYKSKITINHPGLNNEYTGSNQRFLNEFPSTTFSSIDTAIKDLFDFYRTNINKLDTDKIRNDSYLAFCKTKI